MSHARQVGYPRPLADRALWDAQTSGCIHAVGPSPRLLALYPNISVVIAEEPTVSCTHEEIASQNRPCNYPPVLKRGRTP